MTIILQRLELIPDMLGEPLYTKNVGANPKWKFSKKLAKRRANFQPLVTNTLLNTRYSVLCASLASFYAQKEKEKLHFSPTDSLMLTYQLIDALAMAELLADINYRYLGVYSETIRLEKHQQVYRDFLKIRGFKFEEDKIPKYEIKPSLPDFPWLTQNSERYNKWRTEHTFTSDLRATMLKLNFPRLFSVRIRRIFIVLQPLLTHVKGYADFIRVVDPFIATPLNYLSWLFFLPRLLMNLFLLFKHLIPHPWMSKEEQNIAFFTRLHVQMQRHFFELLNDSAWFTAGLLGCFFLVGPLAPIGMCVNIFVFFIDAVAASAKAGIELRRLSLLQEEYQQLLDGMDGDDSYSGELKEVANYRAYLEINFSYEQKRLFLGIINTTALFLAMLLALPMITNMIVPVVGACIVVLITLCNFLATQWLDTKKPVSENKEFVEDSKKLKFEDHRFFPPATAKSEANIYDQLSDKPDDTLPRIKMPGSVSTSDLREMEHLKPKPSSTPTPIMVM